MKTFLLSLAGAFVALVVFFTFAFLAIGGIVSAAGQKPPQANNLVLTFDLRSELTDQAPKSGFAAFSDRPGFVDILTKLDAAAGDPTVKGVFIRGGELGYAASRAEELRAAFRKLRDEGKFVIAHSQGSFSTSPSGFRAISAADEIWMQAGTDLNATGVALETLFMKDLLDNLSITADIEALYEFKNAPNTFQQVDYTEPHREATTALAESIWENSLVDIAEDRGMTVANLRRTLVAGPHSATEAQAAGLIDTLGWPEEALEAALERADGATALAISKYQPPRVPGGSPIIAIVGGEGAIVTGGNSDDLFSNGGIIASDPLAASILRAGRDDRVKAIVFRVDSPGGSPTASDQIWRAVERVQDMGKPVVVSMGSLAASGGYYVSAGADHIVANRTTLTGSIGIFGGKYALAEGLERIGVNASTVSVGGEFAAAYGLERFTQSQRAELIESLERGYDRFTGIVAEGRGMTQDEVHEVARGRVWSGIDAMDQG